MKVNWIKTGPQKIWMRFKPRQTIPNNLVSETTGLNSADSQQVEDDKKLDELKDINKKLEEIITLSGDETVMVEHVQHHIDAFANLHYEPLGSYHGKNGARDFRIAKTTVNHATLITDKVISRLTGKVESLDFMIKTKNEDIKAYRNNCTRRDEDLNKILESQNRDYKPYMLFLAWIYILFAIAMILSDIAVSLNLVVHFNIGGAVAANEGFIKKVANTELFLFSLGIAFCTIYVKILYDDYINTKLGFIQLEVNKMKEEQLSHTGLVIEVCLKLLIKLVILSGLLYFLYYLSAFRTLFSMRDLKKDIDPSTIFLPGYQTSDILLRCFIGISIIIPVISGVALSIGLRIFSNRRHLREVIQSKSKADDCYKTCKDEIEDLTYKYNQLKKHLEEWAKRDFKIKLISDLFVQKYNQGFRVGYRKNFGNDLYLIVEEYRNELINIAFSNKINKES